MVWMNEGAKKRVGTAYKRANIDPKYDAIVIGSGMGSLTVALLLSRFAHKRVIVLEQHYAAGGYTHTFARRGFEWPVGLHYVGQAIDVFSEKMTDGRLHWRSIADTYDHIQIGDAVFDFPSGSQPFLQEMLKHFPKERQSLERYVGVLQNVGQHRAALAEKSTGAFLAELTDNVELRAVLAGQWLNIGLPPGMSSSIAHLSMSGSYLHGAKYPVGGSREVATVMADLIEEHGGTVVVSAEVSRIKLEAGRTVGVEMSDGREIFADVVISGAGVQTTLARLLPEEMRPIAGMPAEAPGIFPSYGNMTCYVGLKGADVPRVGDGSNLFYSPSFDHDKNFELSMRSATEPLAGIYLSSSSSKDTAFTEKYPGHSTLEAIAMVPWHWFKHWEGTRWGHRGDDYEAFKQELTQSVRAKIETLIPGIAPRIEHCELSTPLSAQHFTHHPGGGAYGLAATPERFALTCLKPRTAIAGLYLTGTDVFLPGVEGALYSGVMTASYITGMDLRSTLRL